MGLEEMNEYPCRDCIIRCNCSDICDKLISKYDGRFNDILITNECPDCGGRYVDIRKLQTNFYIVYCISCYSKFTFSKHTATISISRSTVVKGTLCDDLKYQIDCFNKFKSVLISDFIDDVMGGEVYR